MILDHIAIRTRNIEKLKDFYVRFFEGTANPKYHNPKTGLESYFITFGNGSRIELMRQPGIPANLNDSEQMQYTGIIHLAFGVSSMEEVISKSEELGKAGYKILLFSRATKLEQRHLQSLPVH